MDRILVVCSPNRQESLEGLLKGCGQLSFSGSAGDARRRLSEADVDLVIINAPLSDEFGNQLAAAFAGDTAVGVLLLSPANQADQAAAWLEPHGVLVLGKPTSRSMLLMALRFLKSTHRRLLALQQKNRQLLQKLDDMRLVSRAKCLLIEHTGVSEEEAHHQLEHMAMDARITRRDAAQIIIKRYDEETTSIWKAPQA